MPLNLNPPITCLITSGATSSQTNPQSKEFQAILKLVEAATNAGVSIIQIREKNLSTHFLYELAYRCARIARSSDTKLLINDRSDVALAAGAHGVHLTARSIPANIVRKLLGPSSLIGVSTHAVEEVRNAREAGADFVVFGPVFETPSKLQYGAPVGLTQLRKAVESNASFPVLALGGINPDNVAACFEQGAAGVAGITLFDDAAKLTEVLKICRTGWLHRM
jgi:thiamine-phosphate pyrophosphorylase